MNLIPSLVHSQWRRCLSLHLLQLDSLQFFSNAILPLPTDSDPLPFLSFPVPPLSKPINPLYLLPGFLLRLSSWVPRTPQMALKILRQLRFVFFTSFFAPVWFPRNSLEQSWISNGWRRFSWEQNTLSVSTSLFLNFVNDLGDLGWRFWNSWGFYAEYGCGFGQGTYLYSNALFGFREFLGDLLRGWV